ncbi:FHA domain-containing protein [Nocardioides sp. MH1]|uniref:FHA domain-containing protein n=1 Tax=Nocardioides sp. MH1 TaxID=3242490 RepID=UPI00351F9445
MTISTVRYDSGDHRAVVWPGGVVVLDSSVPAAVASATWERLRNMPVPSTLDAVLTEVAEAIGARLLDLPPFAIAVTTGPGAAHVATRGSFEIEATSADLSTTRVSGGGVATWSERQLGSVVRMRIADGDEDGAGQDGDQGELPVGSAVVLARQVVVAEATAAPAPAPSDDLSGFGRRDDPDATSRADDSGHWIALADATPARPEPAPSDRLASEPVPEPEPEPEPEPVPVPKSEPAAVVVPAPGDFDDVWSDFTVAGSVEGAAVRPGVEAPPSPLEAPGPPSPTSDVTWMEDGEDNADEDPAEMTPPPPPRVDKPPTLAPPSDFISSVPGMPPVPPPATPPVPPPAFPPPPVAPPVVRPPVAPPPPVPPTSPPPPTAPPALGDHDGDTIAGPARQAPPRHAADRGDGAPEVLGVLCPSGHGNPPQRAHCRVCGAALTGSPTRIPQPSLGRVVASSGERAELTGPVIIGRAPRASRFQGTSVPRLVTLPHPHISASHLALRVEGWSVLVVDLSSTNGTFLRRNGEPPFRILEQPQLLVTGDVIDLGHGVHLSFEELP